MDACVRILWVVGSVGRHATSRVPVPRCLLTDLFAKCRPLRLNGQGGVFICRFRMSLHTRNAGNRQRSPAARLSGFSRIKKLLDLGFLELRTCLRAIGSYLVFVILSVTSAQLFFVVT